MDNRSDILRMLQSEQEEERLHGLREMVRLGPESAFPALLGALGDDAWRVRKEASELFLSLRGAERLTGEVVELLHCQDNAGLRNAAAEILVRLGRQAVPLLVEELSCPDHDVRKFALDILGDIGDESCVQAMLESLADPDGNVRAAAAENLGKVGGAEALPALLAALEHPDLWFRFVILEALGRIGVAVPLESLLDYREDRLLRKALFDCLGRIGGPDALPVLVEGLSDDIGNVREAAALALVRIVEACAPEVPGSLAGPAGPLTGEAVSGLFLSHDREVRQAAVLLLGWLGDGRCAGRLVELLADDELREPAVSALVAMGHAVVCPLLDVWPGADDRTRAYLAYVFGEVGCAEAVERLLTGLSSDEIDLRQTSALSLGKLGDAAALGPLAACLKDVAVEVQEAAVEALSRLGGRHRQEAFRVLRPLLEHEDPRLRMYAVLVLARLDGQEVEDCLAFALKDESSQVRQAAVRAIEFMGGGGQLQSLMLALTDEDAEVRRMAVDALGSSRDPQALGPLELALRDEDIWVRGAAVRALGHFEGAESAALVESALADPVGLICIAALETLAGMNPERSYLALVSALAHEDEEVVNTALQLLAASGRRDWIDPVRVALLNHRHWEVRASFARTLFQLEGTSCLPLLEERLLVEGEELVRQQLRDILCAPAAGDAG